MRKGFGFEGRKKQVGLGGPPRRRDDLRGEEQIDSVFVKEEEGRKEGSAISLKKISLNRKRERGKA